ncbi:hypothetical protein P3W33_16705, partial [Luteibacter sp. PPL552]
PPSTWRSANAICSSVNFDFFMAKPPLGLELVSPNFPTFGWLEKLGGGQWSKDSQTIVPHGLTQDPANPGTIVEFKP